MRVVVTGGAGFLGSHLCDALLGRGDEVVCVDNLLTGSRGNIAHLDDVTAFEFEERDITEPLEVDGAVDAVMHLASPASPRDYLSMPLETLSVGSEGTRRMLDLARSRSARFVLASTSEVYGDPLEHPQAESYWGNVNPIGDRSVYDEAKRFSEALTAAVRRVHGLDVGIARIFNTYGPRMQPDDGRVISNFIVQALRGDPLTVYGDGSHTRSFCYVDDEVAGLLALLDSDVVGPINIGNPDEFTVLEVADLVRAVTGSTSQVVHRTAPSDDPRRRRPDVTLAQEVLGWAPAIDLATGLARTVPYFADRLSEVNS